MPDLQAQINTARASGYTDAQIATYLAKNRADLAPKISEALHSGYSASDVVSFLGGVHADSLTGGAPVPNAGAQMAGAALHSAADRMEWTSGPAPAPAAGAWDSFKAQVSGLNPVTLAQTTAHNIDNLHHLRRMAEEARAGSADGSLADLAPVTPAIEATEQALGGNLSGAGGTVAGAALPFLAPVAVKGALKGAAKLAGAVGDVPLLPRSGTPVQRAAADWAMSQGAPLDAAAATLNPLVRGAQEVAKSTIGAGSMAERAIEARNQWYADKARSLADQVRPSPETPETAGAQVAAKGVDTIQDANRTANAAYANYKAYEADPKNIREVQTGTKTETRQVPTGEVDANGAPVMQSVSRDVPVKENIPVPVDMRAFKDQFKPVLAQVDRLTRLGQQQYAPAQIALEDLVNGPDFKAASLAEKDLAALKDVSRKNTLTGGVKNEAGALADEQVTKLQSAIDDAVGSVAGPDALGHLRQGRLETYGKYAAIDLVDQFKAEPVKLFQQLAAAKDGGVGLLRKANKLAPEQMPALGRAWLDAAINHATESGGFDHAAKLFNDWRNLGPETKKILFRDPALISDWDKFFQSAKDSAKIENTSKTTPVAHLTAQGLEITNAAAHLLMGNPVPAAIAGAHLIAGNVVARLLYNPRFVRAAMRAMDTPAGSPGAAAAASQLAAAAGTAAAASGQSGQAAATSWTLAGSAPAAPMSPETVIHVPGEANNSYKGAYKIVELDDLVASHNGQTFEPNPKFHPLVNDRDYGTATNQGPVVGWSSRSQFNHKFLLTDSPDALNGAIVTDAQKKVLGATGRKLILDRVYQSNPEGAAAYRSDLEGWAPRTGQSVAEVQAMRKPVLTREIPDSEFTNGRTRQQAISDFNKEGTKKLTPAERAIRDGKRISPETLEHVAALLEKQGPDATLADVLDGSKGQGVLNRLVDDGVMTNQERGALQADNGELTPEGRERVSQLMAGRFFTDPKTLDSIAPRTRNQVTRLAAPLAQVEGRGDWNLTPDTREAVDLLHTAQAVGVKNVDDFLSQNALFANQKEFSPRAQALARAIQKLNPTELVAAARQYAREANDAAQGDSMFGAAPTPAESFDAAFGDKAVDAAIKARAEKKNALAGDKATPAGPKNSLAK